jgi:hypothetical protein
MYYSLLFTDKTAQSVIYVLLYLSLCFDFSFPIALCCLGAIPFCMPACKVFVHTCPECKIVLGKHKGALAIGD